MSLGDNGAQGNNKKNYNKEYYSQYTMSNLEGVESSKLAFSIWAKKMLKVSISPQKKVNDDSVAFDYENNISVYLTHTKALILSNMITKWKEEGCKGSVGVVTGSGGMIEVSDGSKYGIESPCITIMSLDAAGNAQAEFVYTTRTQFHYGIRDFSKETKEFEKVYFDLLEIDQLKLMLDAYVESATTCMAAAVSEEMGFRLNQISEQATAIAEKLGVSTKSGKAQFTNNGTFFDGGKSDSKPSPARTASINDLDDGM